MPTTGRHSKKKGLFDGVEVVNYDTGSGVVDAFIASQDGAYKAFLVRFDNGVLTQVNEGNSVAERAEGGGVTFSRK